MEGGLRVGRAMEVEQVEDVIVVEEEGGDKGGEELDDKGELQLDEVELEFENVVLLDDVDGVEIEEGPNSKASDLKNRCVNFRFLVLENK